MDFFPRLSAESEILLLVFSPKVRDHGSTSLSLEFSYSKNGEYLNTDVGEGVDDFVTLRNLKAQTRSTVTKGNSNGLLSTPSFGFPEAFAVRMRNWRNRAREHSRIMIKSIQPSPRWAQGDGPLAAREQRQLSKNALTAMKVPRIVFQPFSEPWLNHDGWRFDSVLAKQDREDEDSLSCFELFKFLMPMTGFSNRSKCQSKYGREDKANVK